MGTAGATPVELSGVIATDAGMCCLWSPAAFRTVTDYETWESELLDDEDIRLRVAAGVFVPINIRSDGAFGFRVRVGHSSAPAELDERERRYVLVTSEPYRFVSAGEGVVSGIEHVSAAGDRGLRVPVPSGSWAVTVCLIEWDAEPGQRDDQGRPLPTALPDFVVLINPAGGPQASYRTELETFER